MHRKGSVRLASPRRALPSTGHSPELYFTSSLTQAGPCGAQGLWPSARSQWVPHTQGTWLHPTPQPGLWCLHPCRCEIPLGTWLEPHWSQGLTLHQLQLPQSRRRVPVFAPRLAALSAQPPAATCGPGGPHVPGCALQPLTPHRTGHRRPPGRREAGPAGGGARTSASPASEEGSRHVTTATRLLPRESEASRDFTSEPRAWGACP